MTTKWKPKYPLASPQRQMADKAEYTLRARLKAFANEMELDIGTASKRRLAEIDNANTVYQAAQAEIQTKYRAQVARARADHEAELERILKSSLAGSEEKP